MSSTMEMWDDALPFCGVVADIKCKRCGRTIRNPAPHKRYCSERCRKRAERARWKAKWKARGVNKYIGGVCDHRYVGGHGGFVETGR